MRTSCTANAFCNRAFWMEKKDDKLPLEWTGIKEKSIKSDFFLREPVEVCSIDTWQFALFRRHKSLASLRWPGPQTTLGSVI